MSRQIAIRLLSMLISVFGVICLVFLLIHLVPGDPVEMMLGDYVRQADREALRAALGLDKPVWMQFFSYLGGLFRGDLGHSIHTGEPVIHVLIERLPATAHLALMSLVVALMIAFPLGTIAASRKDSVWDYGAMTFSLLGVSIPNFWMGQILILIFALGFGWFPVSGNSAPFAVVLPALTLGTALAAILARMVRSTLLEVLNEDYIRTARAKGLSEFRVIVVHALRNAFLPIITLIGMQLGVLLGGAVITEKIFSWPGIGLLTVEAIQSRDYPLVQGCVLFISVTYVVVNTFTDLVYMWIDPRIKRERR